MVAASDLGRMFAQVSVCRVRSLPILKVNTILLRSSCNLISWIKCISHQIALYLENPYPVYQI